jgi:4-hydroxy-3-methylbut-2-enyl diphosphate reductase
VIGRLEDWGATGVEEQSGIREQVVFALPRELQQAIAERGEDQ